jgi:hypothetical protein
VFVEVHSFNVLTALDIETREELLGAHCIMNLHYSGVGGLLSTVLAGVVSMRAVVPQVLVQIPLHVLSGVRAPLWTGDQGVVAGCLVLLQDANNSLPFTPPLHTTASDWESFDFCLAYIILDRVCIILVYCISLIESLWAVYRILYYNPLQF